MKFIKVRGHGRPPLKKAPTPPRSSKAAKAGSNSSERGSRSNKEKRREQDREIQEQLDLIELDGNPSDRDETNVSTNSVDLDEMLKDIEAKEEPQMKKTDGEEINRKLWVDVIKGNHIPRRDAMMVFEAPKVVDGAMEVEIDEKDVESEIDFWKTGLILFAVGKELSMNGVKQFMSKVWNTVSLPDLFYHDEGYFLARFRTVEDRDMILQNGPYSIYNVPLFIRKWTPHFVMKEDLLRVMPIWVTFPRLPLHLWGKGSLSKIASVVGNPIMADECTTKKLRISYARVLIEMDVTQKRKDNIMIKDVDGRRINQDVTYEWTPTFCQDCQMIGHNCGNVKTDKNKEWRPKTKGNKEVINVENQGADVSSNDREEIPPSTKEKTPGASSSKQKKLNLSKDLQAEKGLPRSHDKVP